MTLFHTYDHCSKTHFTNEPTQQQKLKATCNTHEVWMNEETSYSIAQSFPRMQEAADKWRRLQIDISLSHQELLLWAWIRSANCLYHTHTKRKRFLISFLQKLYHEHNNLVTENARNITDSGLLNSVSIILPIAYK